MGVCLHVRVCMLFLALLCQVPPTLMLCDDIDATREEQLTMLRNGGAIREARWVVLDKSSGKGQLKNMDKATKGKVKGLKKKMRTAADHIKCLSSAPEAGHGHLLDVYMPCIRLKPGEPLVLDPPAWTDRPFLKIIADEAGSGIAAYNYLLSVAGLRGCLDTDKCHRMGNNAVLGLKRAGLFSPYVKICFLANINKGPWLGGRFLETKMEALAQYLKSTTQDPEELAQHLQGIAFDLGKMLDSADYTLDDVTLAADQWLDMQNLHSKSAGMELKRFFSFVYAFPVLNKEWTGIKSVLQWALGQLGEWQPEHQAMQQFEKLKAAAKAKAAAKTLAKAKANADAGAVVGQDKAELPQDNALVTAAAEADIDQTLKQMRQQTNHTLHLCLMCMSSRKLQVQGRMIFAYLKLGQVELAESLKQHKTQADSMAWYAHRACHAGIPMLRLISEVCDDVPWLESLMLTVAVALPSSAREELPEQVETAEQALLLAVEYMSLTAWTTQQHSSTFPWQLAGSLHADRILAQDALYNCQHAWEGILKVEGWLAQPDAQTKWPYLHKLMADLDFHKHQLVRELCHSLDLGDPAADLEPWSVDLEDVRMQLWHMVGTPANTKTFIEDIFRDARLANRLTGYVADRFLRMQHVIMAGINRAHQFGIPVVEIAPMNSCASFNLPKGTLSEGVFVPLSSKAKATVALEHGSPYDVGVPQGNQKPLIDLQPLMGVNPKPNAQKNAKLKERRDQKRKRQAGSDSDNNVDAQQAEPVKDKELEAEAATCAPAAVKATKAEWKAAGNEANFRSIAAMKQVLALHAFMGASSADEAERRTQQCWMGVLLVKGCCYMYQDSTAKWHRFISLGFYGYAASCWLLSSTEVNCKGESKVLLKLSGWQPDEDEDAPPTPSFHLTGSQVKELHDSGRLFGIKTEVALPCMTGSNGLGWFCQTEIEGEPGFPGKQDVILFALQNGAPLTTQQLVLLAHMLNVRLGRLTKGEETAEGITVGRALLKKLFPLMNQEEMDAVLRKIIDRAPTDLPTSMLNDPFLLDILAEMEVHLPDGLPDDLDALRAAADREVHVTNAAGPDDKRKGRVITAPSKLTDETYKARDGRELEQACIIYCSGSSSWKWSTSRLPNDWSS